MNREAPAAKPRMAPAEPFRIAVPEPVLADLRARLERTRWPETIAGSGWSYGIDQAVLRRIVDYWRFGFDWRRIEAQLNALPQFRMAVGGLGIHFIHARGVGPAPLPLILTHGWPGSFLEFLKLIGPLTDPAAHGGDAGDAFDLVIPSLPGYGFSDRPTTPGMHNRRIAELWAQLMAALGYRRYGAQGGDWGAGVSTWLARLWPERMIGLHLNYLPGSYAPPLLLGEGPPLSADEARFRIEQQQWIDSEYGYGAVQRTKPETLTHGLNDSPVGLAGWILEKFYAWGDCAGDLEGRFSLDELLANVTLYWVTETIGSSCRLYYESRATPLAFAPGERLQVPTAILRLPREAPFPPREWVERCYDVARWTEGAGGGHFAALEEPEAMVEDLRAFFRPYRERAA